MDGISKSQVSRPCGEIDERVQAFLARPPDRRRLALRVAGRDLRRSPARRTHRLGGGDHRGRRQHRRPPRGARHDGGQQRGRAVEPIDVYVDLRTLARRGLRRVKLVVSDAHEGLKAAITRVLGATWQRCRVHFMRNALAHAGNTQRRIFSAWIGTAFAEADAPRATAQWRQVADQLRPACPGSRP